MNEDRKIWEARVRPDDSRPNDVREAFVRDRARIIHSAAFRRLQAKTQVLGIGEGDFHRTRLTHSLEVAQVARGIVFFLNRQLTKDSKDSEVSDWLSGSNLIEAISLAHDLGHPPFGHGGEVALNYAMRDYGGFEGNGQTLRILSNLEAHTDGHGLNLTRRTLLGVLKYPVSFSIANRLEKAIVSKQHILAADWKPPKCYLDSESELVSWILEPLDDSDVAHFKTLKQMPTKTSHGKSQFRALDTSIMELADDIAYGVHDLEDAIALGFIGRRELDSLKFDSAWGDNCGVAKESLINALTGNSSSRKRAIGALVNAFISSVRAETVNGFSHPLLKYNIAFCDPANELIDQLKSMVTSLVIKTPQVQTLEFRGQQLIISVFNALESDPERLLIRGFQELYSQADDAQQKLRVLCDYVAGMTDEYATRMYERLFMPRHGQVFDRL